MTRSRAERIRAAQIARLNDRARQAMGIACAAVTTSGFRALPASDQSRVRELIETFDRFTPGNDPHGERDFGAIYQGRDGRWAASPPMKGEPVETLFWKIDAYDRAMRFGSPDPADPAVTHREPSYYSPLSLRLEGFNAGVPDDMMTMAEIASVDAIGGSDFAAMPEVNRFAAIQGMDADAKGRLLALLVARQINGGEGSGSRRDRRHQRFDQIAFASGVDMVAKWQAPVAFYDRLKKPVIAKIMAEVLGKAAADNCAKMKKGELAAAAAERMAGCGWLPPALVIAEPSAEVAQERRVFDEDGEAADLEEDEAA